ncbi:MAG: class B sortase [Oscillospiraceae bacterium]|nr:class B sortase [Oscillospiraceae bacterium]
MTSTYNKRPRARGKVRESNKNPIAYIEWITPKNNGARILLILAGMIPLAVLSLLDWVKIGADNLGIEETLSFNKLSLVTSIDELSKLLFQIVQPMTSTPTELQLESLAEFEAWFTGFKGIFILVLIMLILALAALILSIVFGKSKARAPFAFLGFGLGAATPIVFFYAISTINAKAGVTVLELTLFTYLALLAGLLAMVYCISYPAIGDARGKRNSPFTRAVTSFVPVKGDGALESTRKLIFTAALISFIYFASTLGVDMFNEWRANRINSDLKKDKDMTIDIGEDPFNREPRFFNALWEKNNDVVGYIEIKDTKIDYAVLQTDNNDYYLDYDFDHNPSKGGWIFADFRNKLDGFDISDNTILYGHNITTGYYFAALSNYYRKTVDSTLSFYKEHPIINFDTRYEKAEWKVFASVLFNTQEEFGDVFQYWNVTEFEDEDEFNDYILEVMDRSVLFTDVDLEYGDKLLTMSTCYWPMTGVDTRVVTFARKVRPGESKDVDFDKAKYNTGVLRFDKEKQIYGDVWNGRVWDAEKYLKGYKG